MEVWIDEKFTGESWVSTRHLWREEGNQLCAKEPAAWQNRAPTDWGAQQLRQVRSRGARGHVEEQVVKGGIVCHAESAPNHRLVLAEEFAGKARGPGKPKYRAEIIQILSYMRNCRASQWQRGIPG